MALRQILTIPDKRLREKAKPVEKVDDRLRSLMDDMYETMTFDDQGVGLAANQIGVLERVIVIDIGPEYNKDPLFMANPEIISLSRDVITIKDGCLSVPEIYAETTRSERIVVKYLDRQNRERTLEASGLLSACLQHEIDHLNGILFVDHLTALKRKMVLAKALKKGKTNKKKS
mgnify:CR=1 FL=1|tara:strand:+ start:1751 stop:2272 length:522 start_codon:yes stop_codon:yes gene_type:complete